MTTIPTLLVTPSTAAEAYGRTAAAVSGGPTAPSFRETMAQALQQAVTTGEAADAASMSALTGSGNLTQVVTALSHAEMTLQTATAIRDRVVQAYQDIMKMPI
ncbi:MAG: flagellar hook-basal body complex protein FliE [Rhodospirillales bacterium]|nr:flagellar hook-basal body complex protein FliE [Acetobacter sp.]